MGWIEELDFLLILARGQPGKLGHADQTRVIPVRSISPVIYSFVLHPCSAAMPSQDPCLGCTPAIVRNRNEQATSSEPMTRPQPIT